MSIIYLVNRFGTGSTKTCLIQLITSMKKLLTILVLILAITSAFAQKDSVKGNQFELKGKLIGEVSLPPVCGTIAWGMVVEFEIIEFSDKSYSSETIPVIFTCPEFYGKQFFKVGNTYQITVADQNQASFGWTIPNISVLDKYQYKEHLYVIDAKKLE